jgi:hypothetical protein
MLANFPAPAPASPYGTNLNVFNSTQPNGTWNLYIYDDTGSDVGTLASWSLILETVTATSAPVDLSGRVVTADGAGIRNVAITVQGGDIAKPITVMTTTFGRYTVKGLLSGQSYIVSVGAKKYFFTDPVRIVSLDDNVSDLDFVASP